MTVNPVFSKFGKVLNFMLTLNWNRKTEQIKTSQMNVLHMKPKLKLVFSKAGKFLDVRWKARQITCVYTMINANFH